MIKELKISEILFVLLNIVSIAAPLFLFLRYLPVIILYFIRNSHLNTIAKKFLLVFQFLTWIVFFIWSIYLLLKIPGFNQPFILIYLSLIFVLLVWLVGLDAFTGIILRVSNTIEEGQTIHTSSGKGKIIKIGIRILVIDQGNDNLLTIPFTKLFFDKLVFTAERKKYKIFGTDIFTPKHHTPDQILNRIRELTILSPYCSVRNVPQITFKGSEKDQYLFNISVYSLNKDYFDRLIYKISDDTYINTDFNRNLT